MHASRICLSTLVIAAVLALAACGGGGESSSPPTVVAPPDAVEPPSNGWDHNKRTWSLESARIDGDDAGQSGRRARSSYNGSSATFPPHAETNLHRPATPLLYRSARSAPSLSSVHHGIGFNVSHASGPRRGGIGTVDQTAYGGWLAHSYFELTLEHLYADEPPAAHGFSLGNANFYDPPGSATWNGAVVAYEALGAGGPLYGSAQVVFDLASATVDVMLRPESVASISWHGLAVQGGRFRHAVLGDEIAGVFYGPQAEEVGGVFRRNLVTGAFGAERE